MRYAKSVVACTASLFLTVSAWAVDTYEIDPAHTHIGFSVRHMVVTNVKGKFSQFAGTIAYDDKDITKSAVNLTIQAASIDTDNDKRDEHLKSADFFDAQKFPTLTFQSKRIEKQGEGYVMVGDLTIRGVTREVTVPFTFNGTVKDMQGASRLGAEGELKLNRHDYGVSWSKTLDNGGLVVGNEVKIEFNVEAVQKQ
jgi:polyisoprenoid-binding protein YceI